MTIKQPIFYCIILFICVSNGLKAQDIFENYTIEYNRLRKQKNNDSALFVAKQMSEWAVKNESDTSLKYPVGLRYIGNCFYSIQNNDSAIFYYKLSLEILEFQSRFKDDYFNCLEKLGDLYSEMGEYKSAEPFLKKELELKKKVLGEQHPDYAMSLNNLGDLYSKMGNYKAAEQYYKQSLEIRKKVLGEEHTDYASNLNNLGVLYSEMGDYKAAGPFYKQSLEIRKKVLGEEHPDYAMSLNNLGLLYSVLGDFKTSELYYKQALEIQKKVLGEQHPDYASSLNNLSTLYSDLGDFKTAELYYKQVLEIRRKSLGEQHPDYAGSLNNLGSLYTFKGDFKTAELYYKQALEIKKKSLGEEHPDYASSLNNLGVLYSEMGDFKTAELYYKQSLEIRRKSLGEEHPDYASSLNNLGNLYFDLGDYKASEQYYKKDLEISKEFLGEEHPDYASSLNSLGSLYFDLGDYKAAEQYYKQALEIIRKSLGEEHLDYASSLHNLGNLYSKMGNYQAAEQYYKQALEIRRKSLGEEHPDYASSLNSLGSLYFDLGDYKAAEQYYKQALEIRRKSLGEDHADYAMNLNNLGGLYSIIGNYKLAEPFFKKALEIRKKVLGEDHADYAMNLNNLGNLYSDKGDFKSAELYYNEALDIYKKSLSEEHPDYAMSLNNLAFMYYSDLGNYNTANRYYNQIFRIKVNFIKTNFPWLSAEEKSAFWQKEQYFFNRLNRFSVLAVGSVPSSTEFSYNSNILSKSLLLETSRELDQAIAQSSDEVLKKQFSEMKQLLKLHSKMQSEGSANKEVMNRYKAKADSLNKILVSKLGEYAASIRKFEITWKDVQFNLSATDAAIEFARYYDDKDSLYKYMALVVRPGYIYPKLVKLGNEVVLKSAIETRPIDFVSLYNEVWKNVDSLLFGVQRIYYSTSGILNNVSFAAICSNISSDLISYNQSAQRGGESIVKSEISRGCSSFLIDKYQLHQLTSTRYLADGTLTKQKPLYKSIELVGGVNFDEFPDNIKKENRKESKEDVAFYANVAKQKIVLKKSKNKENRSSFNYGKKMEYLYHTLTEVKNIEGILKGTDWEVVVKSNKEAGEHELKNELGKKTPGILHIATHGFAFPDEIKSEMKHYDNDQKSTYRISDDPLVRSGLMLSGSNTSWVDNPQKMIEYSGDDGILTAAEVANLNLSKTKLVVLSACETGLGKIEGAEGTFGLKRAFKLAGVEQIIVSLWSVPDEETMELMTLFYSDLLKTQNPVISFEKAQKEMRNKYPLDPFKWAGFVLVR